MDDLNSLLMERLKQRRSLSRDNRSDQQKILDYQNARVGYEQPEDLDNLNGVNPNNVDNELIRQGFQVPQSLFQKLKAKLTK
jgi:hypothetical protein